MKAWQRICSVLLLLLAVGVASTSTAQEVRTYYITDSVGSPVVGTDANANKVWTEDYLSYGERRVVSPSSRGSGRWFTAAVQNPDTGLLYMGHRYMDPIQGRFISLDPSEPSLKDGANFNRYWYANDNPYAYVDPNGGNIFSVWAWYDFARANGTLIVNESVWLAATVLGNDGVAQVAVEEIDAGLENAVLSTIGVVSVVPGTERLIKAAGSLVEGEQAAAKATTLALNKAAGRAAEDRVEGELIAEGNKILGSQVSVRTSQGRRVVDHLILTPERRIVAVEVKSGNAFRSTAQLAKDRAMATEGGVVIGKYAPSDLKGQRVIIETIERH